jgi:hypothetical protein
VIRPDFAKWNQTADDVLRLAREAAHPRSRERYMALYAVGTQQSSASQWAQATGRENETVLGWIHDYNLHGPVALVYRHSGGRTPFLLKRQKPKSSASSKRAHPEHMSYRVGGGP